MVLGAQGGLETFLGLYHLLEEISHYVLSINNVGVAESL
jgi:hypothetical protein